MCFSTCESILLENLVLYFAYFVLREPRDKVGSCSDVGEELYSMVFLSMYFQRPDDILEINFRFRTQQNT